MGLKKNFIYNTIYQIFTLILPMITVPYISRVLGPEGVGVYSYTNAYAQYFILLGMVGISLYGNRQIAYTKNDKEKMSKEFWNIYALQVITTTLSLILYIVVFVIINNNNKGLYLVQSITILATIFDISWFFIGYEDMKSVVIRNTITKTIGVIAIFIFVKNSNDVIIYALIMSFTMFLGQVIMWKELKGKVYKIKPSLVFMFTHLKPSIVLFISQLAMQVYVLLDRTMLGIMTNDAQVGLYDNSQKTIKLVLALVTSLGTVMLPRMSSLYAEGKIDKFKEMIDKTFSFITFMAIPMSLGLMAISNSFSMWFYGKEFDGIQILLQVGSLLIIAISWSNILGIQIMLPMKLEKQFTISVFVGAIVNFILNIILIPHINSLGTTIASVIAEFSVTIAQLYFLKKIVNIRDILKTLYKPFIGSFIMYLVISFLDMNLGVNIIFTLFEVSIGMIIYITVMFFLKSDVLFLVLNELKRKLRR